MNCNFLLIKSVRQNIIFCLTWIKIFKVGLFYHKNLIAAFAIRQSIKVNITKISCENVAYLNDIIWDLTNFFFHLLTFSHDKKEERTAVVGELMKEELKFYSRWNLLYELISYSNLPRVHFFTFTRCFLFTDDISMLLNATRIPVTLLKSYFHVLLFC